MRFKLSTLVLVSVFLLVSTPFLALSFSKVNAHSVPDIRINTGGPGQDVSGFIWSACDSSTNCNGYVSGGFKYAKSPVPTITGFQSPANQAIYQTEWTGGQTNGIPVGGTAFSFNIPVENSSYKVRLHFADNNQNAIGKRVFDVKIEGNYALQNFDIFKDAGGMNRSIVREFTIEPTDGAINIDFIRQVENAKISGIEIIHQDPPATQLKTALYVVGNTTLSTADTTLKNRLESKGYQLTTVKDSSSTSAQATGKNVVVISASVSSGNVNTKFKNIAVPVITWEGYLFDDFGMTSSTGLGLQTGQNKVSITNSNHELAAGLTGTPIVFNVVREMHWGTPNSNAIKIATINGNSSRSTVFAYEKNSGMIGLNAPERRVGLFMSNDSPNILTTDGWKFFDSALNWATNTDSVPIPTNTTINWVNKANYPISISEAQGAAADGKLYVFGGFNSSLDTYATSYKFDPILNSWESIADMPQELTHSPVIVDGTKMFLVGGFDGDHPGPSTANVWIYDIVANSWTAAPSLPEARGAGGAAKIGRNLHFFGGSVREAGINDYTDRTDHWVLNLDDMDTGWQTLAPLPSPRNHLGSIGLNGKAYAIGGQEEEYEGTTNKNTVEAYDPATDSWTTLAPMPTKRGHISSSVVNVDGKIFVIGGSVDNGSGGAPSNAVEIYDPATNTWKTTTGLPTGKKTPVADVINGKLYSTTGANTSNVNWEGTISNL